MRRKLLQVAGDALAGGRVGWLARQGAKYAGVRFSMLLGRPVVGPILGTIIPTRRCNLVCVFCATHREDAAAKAAGLAELDTDGMRAALEGLRELGTSGVGFTGGEPLLRRDVPELLAHAVRLGMVTHLNTNGTLLADERVAAVLDTGLHSVNVSLDGATAATHDRMRGVPGALARAEAGLARLLEARARRGARVRVHLTMVLNLENAPELPELLGRARALGVDGVGLIPEHVFASARPALQAHGDGGRVDAVVDGLLRLKDEDDLLESSRGYLETFRHALRGLPAPYRCSAWVSSLVVDPYGRLFPCVPYAEAGRRPVALGGRTVAETARGEDYAAVRAEAAGCRDCHWNCHAELSLLFSGRSLLREAPGPALLHADPRVQ